MNLTVKDSLGYLGLMFAAIITTSVHGQGTSVTGSVLVLGGEGTQTSSELFRPGDQPYKYAESFIDITLHQANFSIWVQAEFSSPPQIGPTSFGLRKARLSYRKSKWDIRIGDIYGQFGRGVALKFWEDQSIDFDAVLRGFWLSRAIGDHSKMDFLAGNVAGGRHLAPGPGIDLRKRDYADDASVSAAKYHLDISSIGTGLSFYWVRVMANNEWFSTVPDFRTGTYLKENSEIVPVLTNQPGIVFEITGESFDFFLESTYRKNRLSADSLYASSLSRWVQVEKNPIGRSLYLSSSYYFGHVAFTAEYKNYMLDRSDPDLRASAPLRLGKQTPIQSPPTVFREQNSILISRRPKQIDFEDEIGYQIELLAQIGEVSLLFNHAASSRQFSFQFDQQDRVWNRFDLNAYLPSLNESFYPFRDFTIQLDTYLPGFRADITAQGNYTDETVSYRSTVVSLPGESGQNLIFESIEKRSVWTSVTQVNMPLSNSWAVSLNFEYQWESIIIDDETHVIDASGLEDDAQYSFTHDSFPLEHRFASLSLIRNSKYSFGLQTDWSSRVFSTEAVAGFSSDNFLEESMKSLGFDILNTWLGIFGTLHLGDARRLELYYGSRRGGLHCESGVCVFVPGINDATTFRFVAQF